MIEIRNFKFAGWFFLTAILLIGLNSGVQAQRRSKPKPKSKPVVKVDTFVDEREQGAKDVGIQLKNVSKFVFVLGGVATGIEEIDKDVKSGKASRALADKNASFKNDVIKSIRALRAGLVKLEVDFRTKPALRPYLTNVQGIIDDTARAEDSALAGRFNQSGKDLLIVVEKLTDVLVEMP
ncbi:MAG: hypothetical protein KDB79_00510 [Acidobacteria bacterium]|nr:hypothetical protein [Acidobacteriota bacterium]